MSILCMYRALEPTFFRVQGTMIQANSKEGDKSLPQQPTTHLASSLTSSFFSRSSALDPATSALKLPDSSSILRCRLSLSPPPT